MIYNKPPVVIGEYKVDVEEFFNYLYLPIKLAGSLNSSPQIEKRLDPLRTIIGNICCNYIGKNGLDDYMGSYIYLTAKNQYQDDKSFNREGWHSDGFGSDDISYIWSNKHPPFLTELSSIYLMTM